MFAQLSLHGDPELLLNPSLLTCPENKNRTGKSCSAKGPRELCSCDLWLSHPFALSTVIYKEICKVNVGVKQPCQQNCICCLEDGCPLQCIFRTAGFQKPKAVRAASPGFSWDLPFSTILFHEALRLAALFLGSSLAVCFPDKNQQQFPPTCSIHTLLISCDLPQLFVPQMLVMEWLSVPFFPLVSWIFSTNAATSFFTCNISFLSV